QFRGPIAEDQDAEGEPGFGLVLLGALIHAGLSFKAALTRSIARRRARAEPPWPRDAAWQDGGFERPLDLAVEPLTCTGPGEAQSSLDASAYAPPAARRPSGQPQDGAGPDPELDIYAPRRVIAAAAATLKPGARALKEAQPSLFDRFSRQ